MRIFVTHILPRELELKYKLSVAACNFSWNLIDGGVFDNFYSIMPTYVQSEMKDVKMQELVYSSLRTKGNILSKIAIQHENWKIYRNLPKDSNVWLYNISSLNLFLFFLLKWFRNRTKVNVIILDYTPATDWLSRLCLWAYNHCDGTITLAESPLFTVKNTVCLPGVTPERMENPPIQMRINRDFLISGMLNDRIAMLSMLLKAFSQKPELTLHITGFIQDDKILDEYKGCKNIIYHGKLNYDDYLKVFHGCSFQLSTRNPECPENRCNFPSKIMEALLHNRIVISTIRYEQLKDVKHFVVSSNIDKFVSEINTIINMPEEQLLSYANQSETVMSYFSTSVWKQNMALIEINK